MNITLLILTVYTLGIITGLSIAGIAMLWGKDKR